MTFIPCNLHTVHNAFQKGLDRYGSDAENLTINLYYWFKTSSARRNNWASMMLDLELYDKLFLRHVQTRWLSLLPALDGMIEKWDAMKHYFLKEAKLAREAKCEKQLTANERYDRISAKLSSDSLDSGLVESLYY